MTSLARHFREHVIPRLRSEIDRVASLLALDLIDWGAAEACITRIEAQYGANRLCDPEHEELLDRICTHLLSRELEAEVSIEAARAELERECAADPIGHYEWLARGSRDPDIIRWAFAAISPKYRDHLLKECRCRG